MRVSQTNENRTWKKSRQSPSSHRTQTVDRLNNSFPKSSRILKHRHYVDLVKNCRRFVGEVVTIDYRLGWVCHPKLGITISKRYGKAHLRNAFKRSVREAFRLHQEWVYPEIELNVYLRTRIVLPSVKQIAEDFISFSHELANVAKR